MLGDFVKDPPAEEFARGLAALTERGVAIMCLYTGSLFKVYNYEEQFDEIMEPYGVAGRIRVEHLPDSTHTFLDVASQRRLMALTDDWIDSVRLQSSRDRSAATADSGMQSPAPRSPSREMRS